MKRTLMKLMLTAVACVIATGCDLGKVSGASAKLMGSLFIGTWPTPELDPYAIDTVPLPELPGAGP